MEERAILPNFHARVSQEEVRKMTRKKYSRHTRHGVYYNGFLDQPERKLFETLVARFHQDPALALNESSDLLQVEVAGLYALKLRRALEQWDIDAVHRLDQLLRAHLRELKFGRSVKKWREEKPAQQEVSPAEWATALLEKARRLDIGR